MKEKGKDVLRKVLASPPKMIPDEMLEFKRIWRREDEEEIYGGADNKDTEGSRVDREYTGDMPLAQRDGTDILPLAKQIRRNGSIGGQEAERVGKREFRFNETGERIITRQPNAERRCRKKVVSLAERRWVANYLQEEYGVSERRTCKVVSINRSTKRCQSGNQNKADLVKRIHKLSYEHDRYGYRKIDDLLKAAEWAVSREYD